MHRRWTLLAAVAGASLASWQATPASAAPSASSDRPAAYVPLRSALHNGVNDRVLQNMDYNGGPVMPSNTDYMLLWSPRGLDAYPDGYVSGLKQWFTDLAHDSGKHTNTDSVSAQYNDLTGAFSRYDVTFGGALLDTDPYPDSTCPVHAPVIACFSDAQLQREIERFVDSHHLATDLRHEYFMLPPPHVEDCFTSTPPNYGFCSVGEIPARLQGFCAYHGNTSISTMLIYAVDPYVAGNPGCDDGNHPNGLPSDGELNGGLSHEQNESVTDPLPNDAWTDGAGPLHGYEVGDQCETQMGTPLGRAPNGAKYNQVINGHFYWYQEEWSNQSHSCLQRLNPADDRPVATFTVHAGSGLTMHFDASGSSAPGGVAYYVWQFNDSFGDSTIERTTPTISHTFPAGGVYSVGLTVMEANGTSTGYGGMVRTGEDGFEPGFSITPRQAAGGGSVQFSALTRVSNQPVINYMWLFGDGTTGSGANPTHEYDRPGTYTVTLVMFSGTGSAFPGKGAGPVSQRTVTVT